ncbi:MAG: hypothetical protein N3G80_00915 [Candidatus Micrarchaeota archaeon]|nr:hypothetical protein [Candidatus Micrarchaeota archaeon]
MGKNMLYLKFVLLAAAVVAMIGIAVSASFLPKAAKNGCSGANCHLCTGEPACRAAGCYWDGRENFCRQYTNSLKCQIGFCEYCSTKQECESSLGGCYWFFPLSECDYR